MDACNKKTNDQLKKQQFPEKLWAHPKSLVLMCISISIFINIQAFKLTQVFQHFINKIPYDHHKQPNDQAMSSEK